MREFISKIIELVNKHKKISAILAFFTLVLSFMAFSSHGLLKRFELQTINNELTEQILREQSVRDSLLEKIKALQYNMSEIERIAREHYGMAKPGEKIFIFREDSVKKTDEEK